MHASKTLISNKPQRVQPVFMHPAIFVHLCVAVGALFALQDWVNFRGFGYHVNAVIIFGSWEIDFLISGVLCWLLWRFLLPFIVGANLVDMLTRSVPLSIVFGIMKDMIFVTFLPNLPVDRPHMHYWERFEFHWKAEFTNNLLIFWCAFFLFRSISYYQALREKNNVAAKLEEQLANATSSTLRTRLEPDFLFNAMNSISSLMRTEVNAAETMLDQLGSFLRMTSERADIQLISLREELQIIEVYISMQDQRYPARIKRYISIDSELYDAMIPAMILQPIVENAYTHGLSKIEDNGDLLIEAHRQKNKVIIVVINSGLGLQPDGHAEGHGVGLANVRSLLGAHYGEDHSFEISQMDRSRVRVTMIIPFQSSHHTNGEKTT